MHIFFANILNHPIGTYLQKKTFSPVTCIGQDAFVQENREKIAELYISVDNEKKEGVFYE